MLKKAFDVVILEYLWGNWVLLIFWNIVKRFQFYWSNQRFTINLENSVTEISIISCGVPILLPWLLWIYGNDMLMLVKCSLFQFAITCFCFSRIKALGLSKSSQMKILLTRLIGLSIINFTNKIDWFVHPVYFKMFQKVPKLETIHNNMQIN